MKRMIDIWCLLIGIVYAASFLHPLLSQATNPWMVNLMTLLIILLVIELGLVHYHRHKANFGSLLQQSHDNLRSTEIEN